MSEDFPFIEYPELLEQLEDGSSNHLLLGNGFNCSLGISTTYESIFLRMQKEEPVYKEIKKEIEEKPIEHDIEKLIEELSECIKLENKNIGNFLDAYIKRKVKFDFMKAASKIVREKIKTIYKDKNQGIYLLFKNFDNYFTLNYDAFLYLLLMKFRKSDRDGNQVLAFLKTSLSQREDLNDRQNNIYDEILRLRKSGELKITVEGAEQVGVELRNATKGHFQSAVEQYSNRMAKKWKPGDIKKVCDKIWEEESDNPKLRNINDGFLGSWFKKNDASQNVFFPHGSFHLYESENSIRKMTEKQNRAVYQWLEEIIQEEDEDIICVLAGTSRDKMKQINDNPYLKKCFEKLFKLSGNVVIFGSDISDNDEHIFQAINQSSVEKIYVSSSKRERSKHSKRSEKFFPKKEIILFNYKSVSYENAR